LLIFFSLWNFHPNHPLPDATSGRPAGVAGDPAVSEDINMKTKIALAGAALLAAALLESACATPLVGQSLPLYEASAAPPPVERVVGPAKARVCHATPDDAREEALARLKDRASSMGGTAVVDVRVEVAMSKQRTLHGGVMNPCLYETRARGEAVVAAAAGAAPPRS
jgi:hypothetical protein